MPASLVLVDVQYDFLPGGALAVPDGDEILPIVHKLLKGKWDRVIVSQDFHPSGHVSFASTHGEPQFKTVHLPVPQRHLKPGEQTTFEQTLWPDHCIQGTKGCEIEESVLEELKGWFERGRAELVQKGNQIDVEEYSAFQPRVPSKDGASDIEAPSFLATNLREHSITTLVVVGLATDYCVRATSFDGARNGFEVYVVREGTRAVAGPEGTAKVCQEGEELNVKFVGIDDEIIKTYL